MAYKKIGTMDFHGGVDITDPCYDKDTWCRINGLKIAEGEYECGVYYRQTLLTLYGKTETWDEVACIGIYLGGVEKTGSICNALENSGEFPADWSLIGEIGVDAGLAGFFHNKPDYSNEEWTTFCDRLKGKDDTWITEDGFFSKSGGGDGCYVVFTHKNCGKIDAVEIHF